MEQGMLEQVKELCELVMSGVITPSEAISEVGESESFYNISTQLKIEFRPKYLIDFLKQYLSGKKSSGCIEAWAFFILTSNAFISPNHAGPSDRYNEMWSMMGKLAAPEIDGKIHPGKAKEYIKLLEAI